MSSPVIIISYGGREGSFNIGVKPGLELGDDDIEQAADDLWESIRSLFQFSKETRFSLHEAETNTILTKETFRDPSCIPSFPKYWYLTIDHSNYNNAIPNTDLTFLGDHESYSSMDCSDLSDLLLMKSYSLEDDEEEEGLNEEDDTNLAMYPSLMELSMGQSPSLDGSREDLMTTSLTCNSEGLFGLVLRHFTVIANVPHSEHSAGSDDSSSQNDSRSGSRCSTRSSSDLYDTLHMSTLFVHSITPGGPAELCGLQDGDIVSSINGQWVSGWTTEELIGIIEDSGSNLVIHTSPEHHDDLLFLYPQYIHGEPGEYTRGHTEKIIVADIIAKTNNFSPAPQPTSLTTRHAYRPASADERYLHHITTELDDILTTTTSTNLSTSVTKIPNNISVNSLSSAEHDGINYNSSNEDLLISGSLADIPVEASPLIERKSHHHRGHSSSSLTTNSLIHRRDPSQDWALSQEEGGERGRQPVIDWFPEADDSRGFNYSLPAGVAGSKNEQPFSSSSMSQSGEFSSPYTLQTPPPNYNSSNKFARKLKATLKSLTGSTSTHRKLAKTSSLGTTQTRSTSALDRLKINNSVISQRSRSTDLGRIKLKDLSLEELTKVNSAENVHSTRNSVPHAPPPLISYTRPSLSQLHYTVQLPSSHQATTSTTSATTSNNNKTNSPEELVFVNSLVSSQLSQERNLSGESYEASGRGGGGRSGGRSYRSQRERLHQTRLRSSATEESLSSIGPTHTPTANKKILHDNNNESLVNNNNNNRKIGERLHHRAHKIDDYNSNNHKTDKSIFTSSSQEHYHHTTTNTTNTTTNRRHSHHVPVKLPLAKSQSLSGGSGDEPIPKPKHQHSTSIDLTLQSSTTPKSPVKIPARRVVSARPLYGTGNSSQHDEGGKKLFNDQKGKFNSVFHGPIQKKQERARGGRKPSERSWKSIYAAIQGHWMVFYGTVQDALTGQPLASEPSLDLRRCVVTVLPKKKHVFRLTFVDSCECLIQAESEEAMMRWMRIIHNLNRHIQRLGPLPPHLVNRGSTQEEAPRTNKEQKLKFQRSRTPQPPKKGERTDKRSRELLLHKIRKSLNPRKESVDYGGVDSTGSPCYNTFGLTLEDCPASYENKCIPLVLMVCLKELEEKWLDTEGLYRVAGPMGQVRVLAEEINKGRYDLLQGHSDPHVLTGILKKFLKELPNPVIPSDTYRAFIMAAREPDLDLREQKLKELISNLPLLHFHTLGFLIKHLNKVKEHSEINKMALRNLCIVFGPTIVRKASSEDNNSLVADMNHTYTIIELLMKKVNEFFPPPSSSEPVVNTMSSNSILDLSPPQQSSQNTYHVLKRGVSNPDNITTANTTKLQRLQRLPRRSYDESNLETMSNSLFSQDRSMSTDEFLFSQDKRPPHMKRRLASSRGMLSSSRGDDDDSMSASRSSPQLQQKRHSNSHLQRKISYSVAIQDASMLTSPPIYPGLIGEDEPFSHQGLFDSSTGQRLSPHHKSYYNTINHTNKTSTKSSSSSASGRHSLTSSYSGGGERTYGHRYMPTEQQTEIVGPSSSLTSSYNNSWGATRPRSTSSTTSNSLSYSRYKPGHESCL